LGPPLATAKTTKNQPISQESTGVCQEFWTLFNNDFEILRETFGVDRRTVERWREWWLQAFAQSVFWKAARAQFSPPLDPKALPQALCEAFRVDRLSPVGSKETTLGRNRSLLEISKSPTWGF
jgi:hypothetical protein